MFVPIHFQAFQFKAYLLVSFCFACTLRAQTPETEEEADQPYDLSPFLVESSANDDYTVEDTNAAIRIRSDLKDFGASISIINQQFMEDLGATDGETILPMVSNVEVGGTQGNFSQVDISNWSTNEARNNPQEAQRIRGLERALLSRDYFRTRIPFDNYNTSRVTINRGQNTALYGLGSAGGVIDATSSRAQVGADFGTIAVRIDHRAGHRQTLDFNKQVIPNRLAIRTSFLNESVHFQQKPAFEKDQRFHLALEGILLENVQSSWLGKTRLRASFEDVHITRNPPDVVPPLDGLSPWFSGLGGQETLNKILAVPGLSLDLIPNASLQSEWVLGAIQRGLVDVPEGLTAEEYAAIEGTFVPKSEYNRISNEGREGFYGHIPYTLNPAINFNSTKTGTAPGWASPELNGVQGIMGRWRPIGLEEHDVRWSRPVTFGQGFGRLSLDNREVFDYHNQLWQGTSNRVTSDFNVGQLFLEQELFNGNAGLEIAYNEQGNENSYFNAFSSGESKAIVIDASSYLAPADSDLDGMADRTPNENLGRPVAILKDGQTTFESYEWDTFRATLFGKWDTRSIFGDFWGDILGSHSVTGLYENHTENFSSRTTEGVWWAEQGDNPAEEFISGATNDTNRSEFRKAISQVYLGPDVRGLQSPGDVRLTDTLDLALPKPGDRYGIWYFDRRFWINQGAQNEWTIIDSLQSADLNRRTIESKAISMQSHLLWNNLVSTFGLREDRQVLRRRLNAEETWGPTGSQALFLDDPGINPTDGNFNEALLVLNEEPFSDREGDTSTISLVGHYPENWLGELPWGVSLSAHYYEADSFEPGELEVNILNEVIENPSADTKEWGFQLSFLNDRFSIRFNEFETSRKNATTTLGGSVYNVLGIMQVYTLNIARSEILIGELFPNEADSLLTPNTFPSNRQRTTGTDADLIGVNSFIEYYERLFEIIPPRIQDIYNYRLFLEEPGGRFFTSEDYNGFLRATEDTVAKGTEIELAGRPTDNWSVYINIGKQETVRSNIGPLIIPVAFEMFERIKQLGLYDIRDNPYLKEQTTIGDSFGDIIRNLRIQKSQEGIASQEQRKWRANLLTRYDFSEGLLKGFSVGGAFRYQDKVVAGYTNKWNEHGEPVPDIANPYLGPDELNGDLFFRYTRKLTAMLEWSIQFNARNLYRKNGDDDIPVTINPDGRVALIRIPNEQQFFLTNTFRF